MSAGLVGNLEKAVEVVGIVDKFGVTDHCPVR
jgi:hypothetical protein